ncbi:hypothetical protein [Roseivirga spongicola]|uniref:Uncharacterized protein n=1 Tax=Roseivirga spongicola TaxID=333140 RepID=A0A150XFM8_9BACT|nr:hypothetical protein [Roseivirga spongicola]KYG77530.1 hypothetical protein AWW68_01800 [Roseivirga spongicola]WPZ11241.1 hypothetical protein T7867_03885 [Roseivirga spongicola]
MSRSFDTKQLKDESLKKLYDYILHRATHIFEVFRDVYFPGSKNKELVIGYLHSTHFQAEAYRSKIDSFNIGIHSPTILLSRTLFDVLVTDDKYGGYITGELSNNVTFPFRLINDVRNIYNQKEVLITKDSNRTLVSSVLTDLTGTFIALHEIGHIVLGHVDFTKAEFGDDQLLEIFSFKKRRLREAENRQAMEHDADMIAARLIPQYIEQLHTKILEDNRYQLAFRKIHESDRMLELLTALSTSAIYAMFLYMFGPNTVRDFRYTAHHHPLTRIRNVVNGIVQTLSERWDFDLDLFDTFYEQMQISIQDIFAYNGMINSFLFKDSTPEKVKNDLARIQELAFKNRSLSQPWSWLPKTEWIN